MYIGLSKYASPRYFAYQYFGGVWPGGRDDVEVIPSINLDNLQIRLVARANTFDVQTIKAVGLRGKPRTIQATPIVSTSGKKLGVSAKPITTEQPTATTTGKKLGISAKVVTSESVNVNVTKNQTIHAKHSDQANTPEIEVSVSKPTIRSKNIENNKKIIVNDDD